MMTSSNGNIFRVTGPLCGKFTGHWWIPPPPPPPPPPPTHTHTHTHKSQWRRALMFILNCAWINGLSKRHRAHYDVTVMHCRNNTHLRPWQNGRHFRDIFQCIFVWKLFYFDSNFIEICFQWSNEQYARISLDNGLAPNRRHGIIRTNDALACWRICASLAELK